MKFLNLIIAFMLLLMLGCSDKDIVGVQETKTPVPDFHPTGVGDPPVSDVDIEIVLPPNVDPADPVINVDELVVFLALVTGGAGTVSLEWDFGDGTIILDGFLIDHIYTLAGTYTVSVLVTDTIIMDGIPTVVGTASDAITLTVIGGEPDPNDVLLALMNDLIVTINDLQDNDFSKPQRRNTLLNKLQEVIDLINATEYAEARSKLIHDIMPKTTGLKITESGYKPYKNVWIINCEAQDTCLGIISDLIVFLDSVL